MCVLWLITFTGCAYFANLFKPETTYSKKEIETVRTDTTFNANIERVLPALKEALLLLEFEIVREDTDSIITFPLLLEKSGFGEYAVQEVVGGYEPVREYELYDPPTVELRCFITPVGRKTKVKVKALFEAYRKEILYIETRAKDFTKGYQEFKGEEINCRTTGRLEKELLACISEILFTRRRKELKD